MLRRLAPWILLIAGCGKQIPPTTSASDFQARMIGAPPGLHNVIRVNDWLYTGAEPEGDSGFQSLNELGIRTVITVDGTKPDLERSAKHGIRYVHVPIGYNAIPQDRVLLIAKAMNELPKPIYLHCHHGKHRGPAAAMAAVRCLDPSWTSERGKRFLSFAGTDPEYSELYASVESASVVSPENLAKIPAEFPPSAPVPDTVEKMLELDRIMQRMKTNQSRKQPFDLKDVIALREAYRELQRESDQKPEDYREILRRGEFHSGFMLPPKDGATVINGFLVVSSTCIECHKKFRNHASTK
jgi:protein tyrosine phosphatase (PTP) superfamily phosphohydrolase (DUF442 family)